MTTCSNAFVSKDACQPREDNKTKRALVRYIRRCIAPETAQSSLYSRTDNATRQGHRSRLDPAVYDLGMRVISLPHCSQPRRMRSTYCLCRSMSATVSVVNTSSKFIAFSLNSFTLPHKPPDHNRYFLLFQFPYFLFQHISKTGVASPNNGCARCSSPAQFREYFESVRASGARDTS